MIKIIALIILAAVFLEGTATAKHLHPEKWYQSRWCKAQNGTTEVVLPDRARVDCLTATHAVEVDFARKWAESYGQCFYYANQTGKNPGILLIMEKNTDRRYLHRLETIIQYGGREVRVWLVDKNGHILP